MSKFVSSNNNETLEIVNNKRYLRQVLTNSFKFNIKPLNKGNL